MMPEWTVSDPEAACVRDRRRWVSSGRDGRIASSGSTVALARAPAVTATGGDGLPAGAVNTCGVLRGGPVIARLPSFEMRTMKYLLAKQGVFRTVQGEGALLGVPMTFIRLAGCSIGCAACDTDYRAFKRWTLEEIRRAIVSAGTPRESWVWVTGGEPLDHDLGPLLESLAADWKIALATAGHKQIPIGWPVLWRSISPHDPAKWAQKIGEELKLIPGLSGHSLTEFEEPAAHGYFSHKLVSPCEGNPETVAECVDWIESHPDWRMTVQAHKQWGLS